ncbi:hypothetical protein SARC_05543 [Sphaeroforma arctica JP610]|uniref:5'-deoxynucleotidase n=1 Tax=Sphaeroforma arctica JP610 TaxID=667725 RepID=A0A0L0FZA6_9EUKA|nr:hypothetical protein SARC_05543 [Sphaeroforma arctica JP610]KNC82162.1 hypothetical protein SARC_05543 [Sphaeroforma arctica JP610]|eukprot:XP_014156064.1 hypothetical protein SARC_05543 [Sphaeroforma arctica JP610]
MTGARAGGVLDFVLLCGELKRTKRTGWVNNNVTLPESISDHMHRMGLLAFLCDDKTLDKTRCVKIAMVHDLAEAIVGDITPYDGVSKEAKEKMEDDAMKSIWTETLQDSEAGKELYELWREYEDASTPEALFVKDLDKFEMICQAFEYEKAENRPGGLQTFFDGTEGVFSTPQVKSWVEELKSRRKGE